MQRQIKSAFALPCLISGLLVGGCAVLTVDVDVYKGPLANTDDVQGEQVISLTMATKPTLVLLRDHLAVQPRPTVARSPREGGAIPSGVELTLRAWRSNSWYDARHISEGWRYWNNEMATVANEILGLYEDIDKNVPPEIKRVVDDAEKLVREFESHYARLHPRDDREGELAWLSVTNGLKKPPTGAEEARVYEYEIESYRDFFYRSTNFSFQARAFKSGQDLAHSGTNANAQFNTLLTEDKLAKAASSLFEDAASTNKEYFTNYVRDLSVTFFKARTNLHTLWRTSLESARQFGGPTNSRSPLYAGIAEAAADLTAFLSNPRSLGSIIRERQDDPRVSNLLTRLETNQLASALIKAGVSWAVLVSDRLSGNEVDRCREGIRRWLREGAHRLGEPLLELDRTIIDSGRPLDRFGLVRGPSTSVTGGMTIAFDVTQLLQKQVALQRAALGNLAGGRLPEGMENLIDNYQRVLKDLPLGERLHHQVFRQMMVSLTDFAQKIVTLGNNAVLIHDTTRPEVRRYVQVLQAVGNSILVQVNELQHQAKYHKQLRDRGGRIAGAITNAGVSDYYEYKNWNEKSGTAKDAAEQLVTLLRAERIKLLRSDAARTTATNITEAVIGATGSTTNSSATLATTLSGGGMAATNILTTRFDKTNANSTVEASVKVTTILNESSASDKLLKAIEAATEMRSGMIYLRPASSYLRSSYPASTLNRNDGQRWENMLQRHALRQTPFIGAWLSGERTDAGRVALELDRQSWQSVNHIRVAGAGAANYVVAKDDVGNWYVKSFSANPSNSFRTIRNLAMFSAGNAFGNRLPIRSADGNSTVSTNLLLNKQAEAALEKYRLVTTNTFFQLLANLGAVTNDLRTAWKESNITTNAKPVLEALKLEESFQTVEKAAESARAEVNKAKSGEEAAAADRSTLSVLRALKRYYGSLRASVQSKVTDERDRAEALQKLTLSIRDRLDFALREREDALNRYEAALEVIGGATSSK